MFDVLPYWLVLTGLYWTMVYGGGIEWIKRHDFGSFSHASVSTWRRTWHLIWVLGTVATVIGMVAATHT